MCLESYTYYGTSPLFMELEKGAKIPEYFVEITKFEDEDLFVSVRKKPNN